jgi:uncharacterized membrane protein YfcA
LEEIAGVRLRPVVLQVSLGQLALVAATLMAGAAVQGTVGFGLGLVAIPLLVWAGLSLPTAIGVTLPVVLVQTSFNCWQCRRELPWREALPMFLLRAVSMPLGVWLLGEVAEFDAGRTKQMIGVFLLLVVGLQWWAQPMPRPRVPFFWTALAGSLSGFMAGTVGMGGPPVSLWVLAHDWSPARQRAFLWLTFLLIMPLQAGLLIGRFGQPLVTAIGLGIAFTPSTLCGAWLGGYFGSLLSKSRLRQAIQCLLLVIAIRSLIAPSLAATTVKDPRGAAVPPAGQDSRAQATSGPGIPQRRGRLEPGGTTFGDKAP